jgi:hypothetical protein
LQEDNRKRKSAGNAAQTVRQKKASFTAVKYKAVKYYNVKRLTEVASEKALCGFCASLRKSHKLRIFVGLHLSSRRLAQAMRRDSQPTEYIEYPSFFFL